MLIRVVDTAKKIHMPEDNVSCYKITLVVDVWSKKKYTRTANAYSRKLYSRRQCPQQRTTLT